MTSDYTATKLQELFRNQTNSSQMMELARKGFDSIGRGAIVVTEAAEGNIDCTYLGRGKVITILDEFEAGDQAAEDVWLQMGTYPSARGFVVAYFGADGPAFETLEPDTPLSA